MPQSKSNRVPCQMCGVEFGKAKYLSQHMLIHEGKTFACSMCSKTFSSRIHLNGHKQSGTFGGSNILEPGSNILEPQNFIFNILGKNEERKF